MRRLFGRALAIREVDAGSCNGCELEISGLTGPVYDCERFGLHFVASPRHADLLLVTGPVTRNMEVPLRKTYEATPDPKLVVAVGDCARTCGVFRGQLRRRGQRRPDHPGGRVRRRLPARAGRHPARHPGGARPPADPSRGDRRVARRHGALPRHGARPRSPAPLGRWSRRAAGARGDWRRPARSWAQRRARAGPGRRCSAARPSVSTSPQLLATGGRREPPAGPPGRASSWSSSRSWPCPRRSSAGRTRASTRARPSLRPLGRHAEPLPARAEPRAARRQRASRSCSLWELMSRRLVLPGADRVAIGGRPARPDSGTSP